MVVTTSLLDGTTVHIRPLDAKDKDDLQAGVRRMSATSRYRRFFSPIHELSEAQLRWFTEIDYRDHFAWVAYVEGIGPERPGIGVARYVRLRERPDAAEFAVGVIDEYQGHGVGTLLLGAVVIAAAANDVRFAVGEVLRENQPMLRLAAHYGAAPHASDPGEVTVELDIPTLAAALQGEPWDDLRRAVAEIRAGGGGIEPPTSGSKVRRSAN